MNKFKYHSVLCLVVFLFFNIHFASSQEMDSVDHRIYVNAGGFFPNTETTIQINGKRGLGTLIFVEDFLNLDNSPSLITANASWKITRRSGFNVRFFHYKVTGKIESSNYDLNIRDTVIHAGAVINSEWTNNYFALNYNYAIFSNYNWSAGLTAGLRTSLFNFNLDYNLKALGESGSYSAKLPIPVILWGLFLDGYMTPRLRGTFSFEMFRLSIENISGLVYENRFGLEYYFLENLGAGLSYNQILYKIDDFPLSDSFDGHIKYSLYGFQLNLHARF